MRIAFFGSSLVSAYWNGAATYYRGLLRRSRSAATRSPSTSPTPSSGRRIATSTIPTGPGRGLSGHAARRSWPRWSMPRRRT